MRHLWESPGDNTTKTLRRLRHKGDRIFDSMTSVSVENLLEDFNDEGRPSVTLCESIPRLQGINIIGLHLSTRTIMVSSFLYVNLEYHIVLVGLISMPNP